MCMHTSRDEYAATSALLHLLSPRERHVHEAEAGADAQQGQGTSNRHPPATLLYDSACSQIPKQCSLACTDSRRRARAS